MLRPTLCNALFNAPQRAPFKGWSKRSTVSQHCLCHEDRKRERHQQRCQLKIPDVSVAFVPVLIAVNARPPRSLNTHTVTKINVVNSHPRVNQVNHLGGGGPRKVFAMPPSSYSSIAIPVGATRREATRCSAPLDRSVSACTAVLRYAECCLAQILWDSCNTSAVIAAGRL